MSCRDTAGQERYKVSPRCAFHALPAHAYGTPSVVFGKHFASVGSATSAEPISRFVQQAPMYYRNANCAVVVYDITQTASLEKARSWIRELQRQADPSIVIALCGNKSDLSARRQVTEEEAKKYAEEEGLMWGETSAKTGEGVADIFTAIGTYGRYSAC